MSKYILESTRRTCFCFVLPCRQHPNIIHFGLRTHPDVLDVRVSLTDFVSKCLPKEGNFEYRYLQKCTQASVSAIIYFSRYD